MRKNAAEILKEASALYEKRNKQYGESFLIVGEIIQILFPKGIILKTKIDHVRMYLFEWLIGKIVRYANNFEKGGHQDSIHDASVYCAMLESVDEFYKENKYEIT